MKEADPERLVAFTKNKGILACHPSDVFDARQGTYRNPGLCEWQILISADVQPDDKSYVSRDMSLDPLCSV